MFDGETIGKVMSCALAVFYVICMIRILRRR